jgi:hypothetical protein
MDNCDMSYEYSEDPEKIIALALKEVACDIRELGQQIKELRKSFATCMNAIEEAILKENG